MAKRIVFYDVDHREAAHRSFDLIGTHWSILTIMAIILVIPTLVAAGICLPIVFLHDLPYHIGGFPAAIVSTLILFGLQSILSVFQQTSWILLFQALVKPQKIEDEDTVIVPEIAS